MVYRHTCLTNVIVTRLVDWRHWFPRVTAVLAPSYVTPWSGWGVTPAGMNAADGAVTLSPQPPHPRTPPAALINRLCTIVVWEEKTVAMH